MADGSAQVGRNIANIANVLPLEAARALFEFGEEVMGEAKQVTPVAPDGGTLRASGHVQPPEIDGDEITVVMGFGGPSIDYAIAVHEHPSDHSPPSWRGYGADDIDWNVPGTGPKFLEGPLMESVPHALRRIAARIELNRVAG